MQSAAMITIGVLVLSISEAMAVEVPTIPDEPIGGPEVYARLVKQADGWRITLPLRRQPLLPTDNEIDVRLNDLSPASASPLTTEVTITCWPAIRECFKAGKLKKGEKPGVKYKSREDALRALITPWSGPFKKEEINAGGMLVANTLILALTAGAATGTSIITYRFDQEAYRKALEEAFARNFLTQKRRAGLISLSERNESMTTKFNMALSRAKHEYENTNIRINFKINNASDFPEAVGSNGGLAVFPRFSQPSWPELPKSPPTILDEIAHRYFSDPGSALQDRLLEIESEHAALEAKLIPILAEPRRVGFECRDTGAYHLSFQCPGEMTVGYEGTDISIPIRIIAKHNLRLGFPNLAGEDKAIEVRVGPAGVELMNKTSGFLKIDTLALYWGDKVSTLSDLKIELPPHTHTDPPFALSQFDHRFLLAHRPAKIAEMTAVELSKLSIKVGLAVKYVAVDSNVSKTFFMDRHARSNELLASRMPTGWD